MVSNPRPPDDTDPPLRSVQAPISRKICITAIAQHSAGEETLVTAEENACSSRKREMAELSCRKGTSPTVQASEEQEVTSVRPSNSADRTKNTDSKSAQMQSKPNLLKYNAWSSLVKMNSLHLRGQHLQGPAMATRVAVDRIELSKLNLDGRSNKVQLVAGEAEIKVSSSVSILESFNAPFGVVEKDKLNSLSDAAEFLEQAESECQAPSCSHERTQQKQEQIDAGDHQQIESRSIRHKVMNSKNDLLQTLKQHQPVVSVKKKMHTSGSNERLKMQNLVSSPDSKAKPRQREFIVDMEQSKKLAAADIENNILRPVQLLHRSSASRVQRLPQHQQSTIGQRGFQSLAETTEIQAIQQTATSSLACHRHPNYPQCQLSYPTNHVALPSTNFESMITPAVDSACNKFINSNPLGYYNPAEEPYTRTNFMTDSPRSGYTATDFNNPCYASPLYGLGNAEHSFASAPNIQLHDCRLSISSDSPTLSSGTKSSPSPYSSPGSPYDVQTPVHISQYSGTGLISPSSSNTRFGSTKPASAHSPSSLAGTSCPVDSVPYFQLEDNVLIMDGVVVEKQSPVQHAWSNPTPPDHLQRAEKSTREASYLGSPSFFPWEHSGSTHFPDARSRQMRSNSLSRTMEESRSGAMGEAKSNAVEVHAAECSTVRKFEWSEHPEYSSEVVQELNLPVDLDFLYEISPRSKWSGAKQHEASSPSKSSPSFLDLSENESLIYSSQSTPFGPCKETELTAQRGGPMNMVVNARKSPAISPAKTRPSFPKHAVDAPPFIPAKGTSLSSTKAKTAQSHAKNSPFLPKTLPQAIPHTPAKRTQNVARAPLYIPAKSPPFPIKEVQSPTKRSPRLPKSAARVSPYTPVKGTSPSPSSPTAVNMAETDSPARRLPQNPKKAITSVSSAKYFP